MMNWIVSNKEWIFSGIGLTVLIIIYKIVAFIYKKYQATNDNNLNKDKFIETTEIKVIIERAVIKFINEGHYNIQINFILSTANNDTSIRYIRLKAPPNSGFENFGRIYTNEGLVIETLHPHIEDDLLKLNHKDFNYKINDLKVNKVLVRGVTIRINRNFSATIAQTISSARFSDGYEDLPINNWSLVVDYADTKTKSTQFSFQVHRSGQTHCIKSAYSGFEGQVIKDYNKNFG